MDNKVYKDKQQRVDKSLLKKQPYKLPFFSVRFFPEQSLVTLKINRSITCMLFSHNNLITI
jgi:hypothetical protein